MIPEKNVTECLHVKGLFVNKLNFIQKDYCNSHRLKTRACNNILTNELELFYEQG